MFTLRSRHLTLFLGLLVGSMLLLAGCDDDTLTPPPVEDELFDRYVSLGNSITAGFQSNGISPATQQAAYPVLLAEQMGTAFNAPLLNAPGCPPPITNPLDSADAGNGDDGVCALRDTPLPAQVNNTAVPGAAVNDLLNVGQGSNSNVLTQLFLGGRTQVETAVAAQPTFVSMWIGNNDVLGAALSGQVSEANVTSVDDFTSDYTEALDALEDAGAEGGVLYGVADPTLIPHFSAGAAYFALEDEIKAAGTALSSAWGSFDVDASCSPAQQGTTTLVPASYGLFSLFATALAGEDVTLNCADDARVLDGGEITLLKERVAAYNQFIQTEAQNRDWAFIQTNAVLQDLRDADDIPPFPNFQDPEAFFGSAFSLDGVHPSNSTHQLIANETVDAINAQYGTSLQPVE